MCRFWSIKMLQAFSLLILFTLPAIAQDQLPALVKKIQPAVATIVAYDDKDRILQQGSGFFIDKSGKLITNRHVLHGASRGEIKARDGKVYAIKMVLAEDKDQDLIEVSTAISDHSVHYLEVTNDIPKIGERIAVIGSPLGLEQTVSDGIFSAIREIPGLGRVFQITAPISPGSSGSPVVNLKGKVIGVALLQVLQGQNLNFAVPADRILNLKSDNERTLAEWTADSVDSGNSEATLGLTLFNQGHYQDAIEAFHQALRFKPDDARIYYKLAQAYAHLDRHQEAVDALKQVLRIEPDNAAAYFNLGVADSQINNFPEAVAAFKQAIQLKPDDAEAYCNLGIVYFQLDRNQEAIAAFKQAIHLKSDYAKAYYHLGMSIGKTDEKQAAIAAFKEAIRLKPDYMEAYFGLGMTYSQLNSLPEAIESFRQAVRINSDFADAYSALGVVYDRLGRRQEAIEAYKQAVRIKPQDAYAHYFLGLSYLASGDKSAALEEYKILKSIDQKMADDLFNSIYK